MAKVTINVPSVQRPLVQPETRYQVTPCGRQFGKTYCSNVRLGLAGMDRPGVYWYIAPRYSQAREAFADFRNVWKVPGRRVNFSRLEINFKKSYYRFVGTGGTSYQSLRGATLHGVNFDECGDLAPDLWPEVIRPMLMRYGGWAAFRGTPKGKNWFYKLYQYSQTSGDPEWSHYHAPTRLSPFIRPEEIEAMRRTMPERLFRQEIEAVFLDQGGEVFPGFERCIRGELEPPRYGETYFAGVDLARTTDFTVVYVGRLRHGGGVHVVARDRFQKLDWASQVARISGLIAPYGAVTYVDATGVGDPIVEQLNRYLMCVPFKFDGTNKPHMVQRLALALELDQLSFPADEVLQAELAAYDYEVRPKTGYVQYGAPRGLHDDTVTALGLLNLAASTGGGLTVRAN